jgi:hypothetical protein
MKSNKYVTAVVLLLVSGGATAACLPDPGSIICQDSKGEYHVAPYSEDSMNKTYEPPKNTPPSYEASNHSFTLGASGVNPNTTNTKDDPKEYFRKYR